MRRIWVPQFIVSLMLLWALNPDNPYGYYILLRIACCAVFAYLARKAFHRERQGWVWILGIMAVVYNPIIPVHLPREIWAVVNVLTIGIAVASIFAIRVKDGKRYAGKQKFTAAGRERMGRTRCGRPEAGPQAGENRNKSSEGTDVSSGGGTGSGGTSGDVREGIVA